MFSLKFAENDLNFLISKKKMEKRELVAPHESLHASSITLFPAKTDGATTPSGV
jgi:hypothetical protein